MLGTNVHIKNTQEIWALNRTYNSKLSDLLHERLKWMFLKLKMNTTEANTDPVAPKV